MQISRNHSLRALNTFGFDISAEYFTQVQCIEDLAEALDYCNTHSLDVLVLGGGSNSVFTRNVSGMVIHMAIDYWQQTETLKDQVLVKVGAGVEWHRLVIETLQQQYFGLENLAATTTLTAADCDFAYRHSIFKTPAGADYIVTGIELCLNTTDQTQADYQALRAHLQQRDISNPDANDVFTSVCEIRRSKLPDPARIGNAGSFFKNPTLSRQQLDPLLTRYPDVPVYPMPGDQYKVAAGWLIDQSGWKGHRRGSVGVHEQQALVLVNHGGGTGQQIATLADEITFDIQTRYGICLEREPVLY